MPDTITKEGPALNASTHPASKAEIVKAPKQLKSGKAAGPDSVPPEALKINPNTTAEMLHPLFLKIWEADKVPSEWKHGYLVNLPKKGDLGLCNNWRGIMLPSILSKVFCRIILKGWEMPWTNNYDVIRQGSGKNRSYTDNIVRRHYI